MLSIDLIGENLILKKIIKTILKKSMQGKSIIKNRIEIDYSRFSMYNKPGCFSLGNCSQCMGNNFPQNGFTPGNWSPVTGNHFADLSFDRGGEFTAFPATLTQNNQLDSWTAELHQLLPEVPEMPKNGA